MSYVVITGASSGIGLGAAYAFAKRGENLILAARRKEALEALRGELLSLYPSLSVLSYAVDLRVQEDLKTFFDWTRDKAVHLWINSAGRGYRGKSLDLKVEDLEELLQLNVMSVASLSHLFVQNAQANAALINVASSMGYQFTAQASLYSASKFFMTSLTEGLYEEMKQDPRKLKIKLYCPSAVKTNFSFVAGGLKEADYEKVFSRFHTKEEAGEHLYTLYQSEAMLGLVDVKTYEFKLLPPQHPTFQAHQYDKEKSTLL